MTQKDTKDDNWSRPMTFHQPVVYFWLSALVSLLSLLNLDVNINLQHFLAWHIFMDKGKWDSVWFCLPLEPCYGWTSLSHLAQACFSFALGSWYSPPIILPRSEIVVLNNERQNAFSYFGSCSIFICTITLQLTCCFFLLLWQKYLSCVVWSVLYDGGIEFCYLQTFSSKRWTAVLVCTAVLELLYLLWWTL